MKSITLLHISLLFLATCIDPYQDRERLATSSTGQVVAHTYYTLSYNELHEQAEWVAYELTRTQVNGRQPRGDSFREDELVLTGTAQLEDYRGSGYDRGHLVPAGDMKFNKTAMEETFVFSNISPQKRAFNSGIWNQLEIQVREWVKKYEHLYIITGPILDNPIDYIGANRVSVPSHFYKVLLDYQEPEIKGIAFLIPHERGKQELWDYAISIDELELRTGINFFPDFADSIMDPLEREIDTKSWFNRTYQREKSMPVIRASQARDYINKTCRVCGKVVDTYKSSSITHLNFGNPFPNQDFSAVIFDDYYQNFDYDPSVKLKNENICIVGKIQLHKNKPQILVRTDDQIELEGIR